MKKDKFIKEIEKYFINIIKLCDNPVYIKSNIRQVANDACSFLYIEKENSDN